MEENKELTPLMTAHGIANLIGKGFSCESDMFSFDRNKTTQSMQGKYD